MDTKKTLKYSLVLFLAIIIMAIIFIPVGDTALADEVDLDSVQIISQQSDITAIYGDTSTKNLMIGINYTNVICSYRWWRSYTESGTAVEVDSGTGNTIYLSLSDTSDTGYYYCQISNLVCGTDSKAVNILSNKIHVEIQPKPIDIVYADKDYVYNGTWQTPEVSVNQDQLVGNDIVNVIVDRDTATTHAGTYPITLSLDNDNYTISTGNEGSFRIKKATLQVSVEEVTLRKGDPYEYKLTYSGLVSKDKIEDLNLDITIPDSYKNITEEGVYDVYPEGPSEIDDYYIEYVAGKLYVDKNKLEGSEIEGFDGSVTGMFSVGTKFTLKSVDTSEFKSLFFTKIINKCYDIAITNGKTDGDTYTINIKEDLSSFCLSVCYIAKDGTNTAVNNFKYSDGTLSVTLDKQISGSIVIYHDYTILFVIVVLFVLMILILLIVKGKDRRKYKRALRIAKIAEREANKYRK